MAPIDAAKFDAHKNINTVIIQFLCHNKGKGFSAKEIADAMYRYTKEFIQFRGINN
ncbi:MAG: hypothetical protein WCA39_01740 [Nitrososphaeraceae archaeon]|jgi:hypothetical protein